MDHTTVSLAERRSAVEAARVALSGLTDVLHQASGSELAELLTIVDGAAAGCAAASVSITAEALTRGEIASAGTNAHAWVRDHAPSLRQGGAGHVATLASAVTSGGIPWNADQPRVDPESPLGIVAAGVESGVVTPGLATAALRELDRLDPHLRDEAKPTVARAMLDLGVDWGPSMMRRLRPRLLAEYGLSGQFDDLQDRLARVARLSAPFVRSGDLTEYQLLMTPEQATALEAAIGPLSAPAPDDETGERDLRPSGRRRVEALAEVCRRSSALDAEGAGPDGAAAASAAVYVTVALSDLEERIGCGSVLNSTATGTVLSPEILRRLTCDADLIPVVLGTAGEELDLGRVVRLFTRAQRRRLRLRDGGCTYPGCGAPAAWTRAHHVVHWADGGRSDIENAALLCQRHHTVVHNRRLFAQVRSRPDERGRYVVWDRNPGSYDRHLERLRAERAENAPAPLTPARLRTLLDDLDEAVSTEPRWGQIAPHQPRWVEAAWDAPARAGAEPDEQWWSEVEVSPLAADSRWWRDDAAGTRLGTSAAAEG